MRVVKKGDRVFNQSYGIGTIVSLPYTRGEPIAHVRWDAFLGTRHDRPFPTPLAGLDQAPREETCPTLNANGEVRHMFVVGRMTCLCGEQPNRDNLLPFAVSRQEYCNGCGAILTSGSGPCAACGTEEPRS